MKDKQFHNEYSAVQFALYKHPAASKGTVHVMELDGLYVVTTRPQDYVGWKNIPLE